MKFCYKFITYSIVIASSLIFFDSAFAEEWKIGLVLCFSGECAADGSNAQRGFEIAAEELNSSGGVLGKKITFIAEDTKEAINASQAISAYKKLRLDKDIDYFIGPSWTPAGLALAPVVAREKQVLMVTPTLGVKDFHAAGKNVFNARGTDDAASTKTAKFAFDSGWKTAVIIGTQQPWELSQADTFASEFEKKGGKILGRFEPVPNVFDFRSEAVQAVKLKPDVIFIATIIRMNEVAKALRALNYSGPKLASIVDNERLKSSEGSIEGTIFSSLITPNPSFSKKFKEKYNEEVDFAGALGYDTLMLLSSAVKKAGTFNVSEVQQTLLALDYKGASGQIAFDSEGGAKRSPMLMQVKGSQIIPFG